MTKRLNNIESRVEKWLSKDVESRNNDGKLILNMLIEEARNHGDYKTYISFKCPDGHNLALSFPYDSIVRARAKIQNKKGLYLPTLPEVRKKRKQHEKNVSNWVTNWIDR